MKPVGAWILRLEEAAHVGVDYLILLWPGGTIEFQDSLALDTWHPQEGFPIDARAMYAHEFVEEDREYAERLCTFTRKIKLDRRIVKQILRANRRGIVRDCSKLPCDDPWRGQLDLLATVIDKQLEKTFGVQSSSGSWSACQHGGLAPRRHKSRSERLIWIPQSQVRRVPRIDSEALIIPNCLRSK